MSELESISLRNFKCFSAPPDFTLAPLTMLYGPNSGGKSSLLHALLALKQSVFALQDGPEKQLREGLKVHGPLVDLGNGKLVVHNHETKRLIGIRLKFSAEGAGPDPDAAFVRRAAEHLAVELRYRVTGSTKGVRPQVVLQELALAHLVDERWEDVVVYRAPAGAGQRRLVPSLKGPLPDWLRSLINAHEADRHAREQAALQAKDGNAGSSDPSADDSQDDTEHDGEEKAVVADGGTNRSSTATEPLTAEQLIDQEFAAEPAWLPVRGALPAVDHALLLSSAGADARLNRETPPRRAEMVGLRPALDSRHYIAAIVAHLIERLARASMSLVHIGPWREPPAPLLSAADWPPPNDHSGSATVQRLANDEEGKMLAQVNDWMARLGFEHRVGFARIGHFTRDDYLIPVWESGERVRVGARSVGNGANQVLPIVAAAVTLSNRVILVEQPELHLHPRLQTELVQLLAWSMVNNGNQFLVETHSEHMLLRLQRLIRTAEDLRDDQVNPSQRARPLEAWDVSVLYIDQAQQAQAMVPVIDMTIDQDGELLRAWPGEFFDVDYQELFQ